METVDFTKDGTFVYDGIELRWSIETENCVTVDGQRLTREYETFPSRISTNFEINIHP